MLKTRILLHAFDPLDGDVVRRLVLAEADMEVVAEVGRNDDLVDAVHRTHADVVVASMTAVAPTGESRRLLAESTRLRVLAFSPRDTSTAIEFVQHDTDFEGAVSPQMLLEKIRGSAA